MATDAHPHGWVRRYNGYRIGLAVIRKPMHYAQMTPRRWARKFIWPQASVLDAMKGLWRLAPHPEICITAARYFVVLVLARCIALIRDDRQPLRIDAGDDATNGLKCGARLSG
jgi:hypothetical protein